MTGIGSASLARFKNGEDLSPLQSIKACCADCVGYYADGRLSCETPDCPLFPFMPYNPRKKTRQNPSRQGIIPTFGRTPDLPVNGRAPEIVEDSEEEEE